MKNIYSHRLCNQGESYCLRRSHNAFVRYHSELIKNIESPARTISGKWFDAWTQAARNRCLTEPEY